MRWRVGCYRHVLLTGVSPAYRPPVNALKRLQAICEYAVWRSAAVAERPEHVERVQVGMVGENMR